MKYFLVDIKLNRLAKQQPSWIVNIGRIDPTERYARPKSVPHAGGWYQAPETEPPDVAFRKLRDTMVSSMTSEIARLSGLIDSLMKINPKIHNE